MVNDQAKWEKFLKNHGKGNLFQAWEWGEVQQYLGFSVRRLGLYEDKELIGLAQTIVVPAKRGKFIHLRHGPVFRNADFAKKHWIVLIDYLRDFAKKERAWFLRMSPLIEDSPQNMKNMAEMGFRPAPIPAQDAEVCWVLDLNRPEEQILAGMRKTTRYLIRQAEKLGVVVEVSQDIDGFLKLYRETARRQAFVPHRGVREEYEIFSDAKKAILLAGKYKNQLLAGAIILFHNDEAIYHHGASVGSKVPVTYLLQWRAILEAKKRGLKYYNFWGIAPDDSPRHPWRGLTSFKQGFGGRSLRYLHAHDLPLSPRYHISYMIERLRKIARGF